MKQLVKQILDPGSLDIFCPIAYSVSVVLLRDGIQVCCEGDILACANILAFKLLFTFSR